MPDREVGAAGQVLSCFNSEVGSAGSPDAGKDPDRDGIRPSVPFGVKKRDKPDPDL